MDGSRSHFKIITYYSFWRFVWSWFKRSQSHGKGTVLKNHFLLRSLEIDQNSSRFARTIKVNERGAHASALSWLDISLYLNFEAKSNSYKIVAFWFWSFCQKWLIRRQKRTFTSTHMHSWIFRIVSQFLYSDVYLTFRRIEFSESAMKPNFLCIEQIRKLLEIIKHRKVDKKPELVGSCLLEILGSDPNSQLLKSLYILEVLR